MLPSLGKRTSGKKSKIMSFVNDLRVAVRSLARTQGLAVTVLLTLALGIGANAAIFTLVRGVLLKPDIMLSAFILSVRGVNDPGKTMSLMPSPTMTYPTPA